MYPKSIATLTGVCLLLLSACTSAYKATDAGAPRFSSARSSHSAVTASISKQKVLMGPPEYRPEPPRATIQPPAPAKKIVERGGRYVYVPAAYIMARPEKGRDYYSPETLLQKIRKIKKFAARNNYDSTVAFFIDMQVKSSKERFFAVDLVANTIIKKGMVAHGKGDEKFSFDRKFSNEEGSNCTSLGVYKIGKAYNGAFGLSYKLYGLNSSNSNALKRYVVLHAMGSIPDAESKWPITQTEGCPAVSPAFLASLAPILDNAHKSILLYIYY